MIFDKSGIVPYGTTGGLDTVAVRMPSHEIAREVIDAGGGYIAAPARIHREGQAYDSLHVEEI